MPASDAVLDHCNRLFDVGPSKSALKAMLVNLDTDDTAVPPLQSGAMSPPGHLATTGMVDIHVPDGKSLNF